MKWHRKRNSPEGTSTAEYIAIYGKRKGSGADKMGRMMLNIVLLLLGSLLIARYLRRAGCTAAANVLLLSSFAMGVLAFVGVMALWG